MERIRGLVPYGSLLIGAVIGGFIGGGIEGPVMVFILGTGILAAYNGWRVRRR